jgi:hypothetical protein
MSTTISGRRSQQMAGANRYLSPNFLLRVAGLPLDTVDALRCVETTTWAQQVISLETKLEEKRERLLEALHQAVHVSAADPVMQRILLNLKRDVFNRRAPKDDSKARQASDGLPEPERPTLAEWLADRSALSQLLRAGQRILEEELQARRISLKSTVQDESFRRGLLLSSATLERDIEHYLKASNHHLNRRLRLVERALLLYLLRTACKTSPFSTFTAVACGCFDETPGREAASGINYAIASLDKQSFIQLNVGILSRFSALLLSCPDIYQSLPVHLNTGWDIQGDRLRYMRRKITLASEGEPFDKVEESFFYLPLSPTLRHLIDLLDDRREVKIGALARELAASEGNGEDESEDESNVEMFLSHLLRLGLLVAPDLHVSLSHQDPLNCFRQSIKRIDNPVATRVAAHLQHIEALISDYALAAVAGRRQLLEEVKQEVKSCYAELAGDEREIPRTILYEDATIAARQLSISPQVWKEAIRDLQDIQNLLPIFDMMVINRRVMNGFYKLIHGKGQRCDDVLSFAEVFSQDYYKEFLRAMMRPQFDADGNRAPSPNHFQIPEISVVNDARRAFAECISQSLSEMAEGSSELVLTKEPLQALAERIPQSLRRLRSDSFFCQLAQTEESRRLVINHVYNGLTQMASRFIYPLQSQSEELLAAKLQATLEEIQPQGAVFAELSGASETNLNLHPGVTRYELLFPGEHSSRPLDEQIQLDDLFIQHDPLHDCLRLYSKRLNQEVIPLYLGQLLQTTLSDLRQVMLNFSYASFPMLDLWSGVTGAPELNDTITFFPRIVYGELVLERAMWKAAAEYLPGRQSNQSDADYFLTITRWQKQHGIARKVFVSPDLSRPRSAESPKPPEAEEKQAAKPEREAGAEQLILKPMYVDFENYFTVLLFERAMARGAYGIILTEVLPDEEQLWLRHEGRPYVTELVIEMNRWQEEGELA